MMTMRPFSGLTPNWMLEPPVSTPTARMTAKLWSRMIYQEFLVRERLDGGDGDAVAGVDAHGVEVFDAANDDAVVGFVAHHFHFVFLPAEQRFLDEHFVDGREFDAAFGDFLKFLAIVGNAAAGAAEGVGGADDEGQAADFIGDGAGFLHIVGGAGDGDIETDAEHEVFEDLAVFAFFDGFGFGADHFDAVFFEHTAVVQFHGGVQGGLAAEGGE